MELVERYTPSARWFHCLIVVVFLELVLSGLLVFIPWQALGMVAPSASGVKRSALLAVTHFD